MWSIGRAGARQRRRLILLRSVGWLPPALRPSGAGLARGTRGCVRLFTPSRVAPHRGGVSADAPATPRDHGWRTVKGAFYGVSGPAWALAPLKARPPQGTQGARAGAAPLGGLFPSGAALSGACTESYLGLPTDSLARLGPLLQASWQLPAACGRGARGPGPFPQSTAGLAVARLGATSLLTPLAR
jgi:hypothetical protein